MFVFRRIELLSNEKKWDTLEKRYNNGEKILNRTSNMYIKGIPKIVNTTKK